MNKQRRKTIDELIEKIEALKDDVQSVLDDEQEYRDGIPESMTEKQDVADAAIENLDSTINSLDEAMNEYARKGAFVEKYLSPMLAAADMQIERASYRCHIATGEEYVDIIYIGGLERRVCVTADSLQALILDVMR